MILDKAAIDEINRIQDFPSRIERAALYYAELGLRVVPIRKGGKALPSSTTGINYTTAARSKKTIQKWFGPEGPYRGWNIGLVCGYADGVFAIDVDNQGIPSWHELIEEHGQIRGPVQQTPSGGYHVLTQWRENLRASTNGLGQGIDTRGGDGTGRSHIVVWPSIVDDNPYEWVEFDEILEAPQWVSDILGVPWQSGTGRGNENVEEDDEEQKFGLTDLRAMLDSINPNDLAYEQWLMVGQALNTQHPNSDGLQLWDEWSRRGDRYESGECHKRWQGFDPAGPVRIGTLIHYAREAGYDIHQLPKAQAGVFDDLVEEYNNRFAVVMVGGKARIAHRDQDGDVHVMGREDFGVLTMNEVVTGASGKPVLKAKIWMGHEERRTCYKGIGFFPDAPVWHNNYVNLWRGWGVEPKKGDWGLFHRHVVDVICNGNSDHAKFVFDWMADIFQDPMRPKGTALVLHGIEGCGKGTLCYFLGRACGHHYRHITHESHLIGNFNSHMQDCLLAFGDEVTYGGSKRAASVLKAIVTERELVCERKGVDAFQYENRTRLVVASNEPWFIPAGPNSRRWLVLDVNGMVANNRSYFDSLYEQMGNGGTAAMMYDLLERNITSNLSYAPETEALQEQRNLYRINTDPIFEWIDECVDNYDFGTRDDDGDGWPEVVDRILLYDAHMRWRDQQRIPPRGPRGRSHFYRTVELMGFEKFRSSNTKNGIRRWCYRVPPRHQLMRGDQDES